jgi:hypothetical protein
MNWTSTGTSTDVLGNGTDVLSLHQTISSIIGSFSYNYSFTVTPAQMVDGIFTRLTTKGDAGGLTFTSLKLDGVNMSQVQDSFNTYWEAVVPTATSHNFSISGYTTTNKAGKSFDLTATATPIPAAIWLFGSGIAGLVGASRRKSKAA